MLVVDEFRVEDGLWKMGLISGVQIVLLFGMQIDLLACCNVEYESL